MPFVSCETYCGTNICNVQLRHVYALPPVVYFLNIYVCRKYTKFNSCSARSNKRQATQVQMDETATRQIIQQSDEHNQRKQAQTVVKRIV